MPSVTIIIPAYNAEAVLERSLQAIARLAEEQAEIIVVDDGSTDGTAALCARYPVTLLRLEQNLGPARARNLGANLAASELLVFLDADTCLAPGGLDRIAASFESDPELDALIGSYDDQPAARGTVTEFRNLLHCFVHRTARRDGSTFWSGCGAIRREVFLEHGGFDESYRRASIEDLELGYRLRRAARKIVMDPAVQVKHLKRWTLISMMRTDLRDRGIPWTELILREKFMPDDLNLRVEQRLSVAGVFLAVLLLPLVFVATGPARIALAASLTLIVAWVLFLNRAFYRFLFTRRGTMFTMASAGLHLFFYFYNGLAFGIGTLRWLLAPRARRAPAA